MIVRLGAALIVFAALCAALSLVIAPLKFFSFLSSVYGCSLQRRDVPIRRYRFVGAVMTLWILAIVFLIWWKNA